MLCVCAAAAAVERLYVYFADPTDDDCPFQNSKQYIYIYNVIYMTVFRGIV